MWEQADTNALGGSYLLKGVKADELMPVAHVRGKRGCRSQKSGMERRPTGWQGDDAVSQEGWEMA